MAFGFGQLIEILKKDPKKIVFTEGKDPRILEAVDYVCWSRRQEHKPHTPSSIIKLKQNGEVTVIRK